MWRVLINGNGRDLEQISYRKGGYSIVGGDINFLISTKIFHVNGKDLNTKLISVYYFVFVSPQPYFVVYT